MAGQTLNWIADKVRRQQRQNNVNLGQLRASRRFDRNNYENVINNVTERVTSDPSQRLAVTRGLGLTSTQNLIIGGQRDGGQRDGGQAFVGGPRTSVRDSDVSKPSRSGEDRSGESSRGQKGSRGGKDKQTGRVGTGLPSAPITPE